MERFKTLEELEAFVVLASSYGVKSIEFDTTAPESISMLEGIALGGVVYKDSYVPSDGHQLLMFGVHMKFKSH